MHILLDYCERRLAAPYKSLYDVICLLTCILIISLLPPCRPCKT